MKIQFPTAASLSPSLSRGFKARAPNPLEKLELEVDLASGRAMMETFLPILTLDLKQHWIVPGWLSASEMKLLPCAEHPLDQRVFQVWIKYRRLCLKETEK